MAHRTVCLVLAASLASAPALSFAGESWQDKLKQQLKNDNVSRTLGTVAGALLGSQIGDGRGQVAAIAAGAVAGYWLGGKFSAKLRQSDRAGIASATERAIETGETTTWTNPDTGVSTRVSVGEAERTSATMDGVAPMERMPPLEVIDAYYVPTVNLNVRGGPGTDYRVLYTLKEGTAVPVIGRVSGSDWFAIAEGGEAAGFIYAPMTAPAGPDLPASGAVRDAIAGKVQSERHEVAEVTCRDVTQEVTLNDGSSDSHAFRVCQQPDGSWVQA